MAKEIERRASLNSLCQPPPPLPYFRAGSLPPVLNYFARALDVKLRKIEEVRTNWDRSIGNPVRSKPVRLDWKLVRWDYKLRGQ